MEVLRTLECESADLIYIDPPFNTGKRQARTRLRTVRDEEGERTGFGGRRYRTGEAAAKLGRDFLLVDNHLDAIRIMAERLAWTGAEVGHFRQGA